MSTTATSPSTREVDGRTVPVAGAWTVDRSHSAVEFVVRHLMVAKVRGRFAEYEAQILVGERPEDSSVDVTINAASITTGDDGRDDHLRSADFLDAVGHPTLSFSTRAVRPTSGDVWAVDGDLSIRGVSKPITLSVEFGGVAKDPWGNEKAFFTASTEFDREDWGLTYNAALETGGVLIGKKIRVEIEIEAARSAE